MSTTGHETEVIQVQGLKESLKDAGNKAIFNEATCSTAGGTAAKATNTVPPSFSLVSGATIIVKFTYAISVAGATLNVGETGAKPIYYRGAALPSGLVAAGAKLLLRYNGTAYEVIGNLSDPTLPARVEALEAYFSSSADSDTIINKWQEVVAFLNGISESDTLSGLLRDISGQIPTALSQLEGDATHRLVSDTEKSTWNSKQNSLSFNTPYNESTNKAATMADIPAIENFHEAVATLQSAPTSSTLTYQRDGQTYNYKIGDEVRVADSESGTEDTNNYVFYKLYDLVTSGNTTTAYWALAGAGGGGSGSVMGKIRVNLRAYVNDVLSQGTDLNGVEVSLTNTTNSEVVGTQTWAGTTLVFTDVTPMKAYSISVSAKTGYTQPAAQTIAELPFSADETLTFDYEADEYTARIQSNQGTDSAVSSAKITIAGTAVSDGGTVKVSKGTAITPTASAVTGYSSSVSVSGKTVTAIYSTCKLTVSLTSDTGEADLSGVTITVTDTTASAVVSKTGSVYLIPGGHGYKVSVSDDVEGYSAPSDATGTASGTTASVTMTYEEVTMVTGYIILDQTSTDPTKKVIDEQGNTYSGYQRPEVITAIRQASHCYVGTFANNKMTLKQLDDTDGTKYADGTSAATDIATVGKDVWMRLPEFYTKVSTVATDKIKIEFAFDPNQTVATTAQPEGSGWMQWGGNDLIGKYEAYETNDKTYSCSGVTSTDSVSQANFKAHARARGTGFTIVKWRHQNLMAILFYAYYGHTNCQSLIGRGTNSYAKKTGLKNSLGMTDTTSANGNTDNIVFWGLENWWGNKYEWEDNVVVNSGTWTITEDDGSTRTLTAGTHVMAAAGAWVYPSKFYLGDYLDTVGAVGQTGGSDSTGYCDGQYIAASASLVLARSLSGSSADGGVAYAYAGNGASSTSTRIGSRLAFTGEIEIV